jgi:hypothetical protein
MTSNARGSGGILGSLRSADGKGIVRMQDRFDTDIDDLWSALTDPRRLARWPPMAARPSWSGRNGACPWTCSPPTGPGSRSMSKISLPTSPGDERCDADARWAELQPAYQDLAASVG